MSPYKYTSCIVSDIVDISWIFLLTSSLYNSDGPARVLPAVHTTGHTQLTE